MENKTKKKKIIKFKIPKCKECNGKLEPGFTTELDENSNKKPKVIIATGTCKKCEIIYILELIKTEELPSSFEELERCLEESKGKDGK